MTTDLSRLSVALVLASLFAATDVGCGSARNGDVYFDPAGHPPDVQASYAVFARRCSKCHSLARPLLADVDNLEHWDRYVARMVRQPNSGITRRDAGPILSFLYYYTTVVRARRAGGEETPESPAEADVEPRGEPSESVDETPPVSPSEEPPPTAVDVPPSAPPNEPVGPADGAAEVSDE
jgi:hypothetical protein